MLMLRCLMKYEYRIRKPRVFTQNLRRLTQQKKQMTQARKIISKQTQQYYNKLQDEFIQQHKENVRKQHFLNQCNFRKHVIQSAFNQYRKQDWYKKKNQEEIQKLQSYIHKEEVKKLNRNRIKKIIQYESQQFWINEENVNQRLKQDILLPDSVASTEYYHKLYSQAIAIQMFDFETLHKMSSNEQSIKQKNKLLIPFYQDIIRLIKKVKDNEVQKLKRDYKEKVLIIRKRFNDEKQRNQKLNNAQMEFNRNMLNLQQDLKNENWKKERMIEKVKDLLLLLRQWKQYTNILSLTSVEMKKMINQRNDEKIVQQQRRQIEKSQQLEKKRKSVDTVEQDTDDQQITLQKYIRKSTIQKDQKEKENKQSQQGLNLQMLLKEQQMMQKEEEVEEQIKEKAIPNLQLKQQLMDEVKIIQERKGFKNEKQTTTTIESLKQIYKQDKQINQLLNAVGQITIDYPQLFKKVYNKYSQ